MKIVLTSFSYCVFLTISSYKVYRNAKEGLTNSTNDDFHNTGVILYSDALNLAIM